MKIINLSVYFLFALNLNAQNDLKLVFSLTDDFSFGTQMGWSPHYTAGNMFNSYRFDSGVETQHVRTTLSYAYGGQYSYNNDRFNDYNFHLLGVALKFYFFKNRKVRPFISLDGASEIGSTSKGVLLNDHMRTGNSNPGNYNLHELSQYYGYNFSSYASFNQSLGYVHYVKTTFVGGFKTGASFQLYKQLKLDFGIGIGLRNIKAVTPSSNSIESGFNVFLDAQLGLSYSFPLNKKPE